MSTPPRAGMPSSAEPPHGSLRVLEILSRAAAVIAEGEVGQLVTANDTTTTESAYLEVVEDSVE